MFRFSPVGAMSGGAVFAAFLTVQLEKILTTSIARRLFGRRAQLTVTIFATLIAGPLGGSAAMAEATVAATEKGSPQTMLRVDGDELPTRPPLATGDASTNETVKLFAHYMAANQEQKLKELFAANSVWLTPSGVVLHGPEEIGQFLAKVVAMQAAKLAEAKLPAGSDSVEEIPFSILGSQHDYFIELAIKTPFDKNFELTGATHLTLDDSGKIIQVISYLRPRAVLMMQSKGMMKESPAKN
jgi:hypothetical protein